MKVFKRNELPLLPLARRNRRYANKPSHTRVKIYYFTTSRGKYEFPLRPWRKVRALRADWLKDLLIWRFGHFYHKVNGNALLKIKIFVLYFWCQKERPIGRRFICQFWHSRNVKTDVCFDASYLTGILKNYLFYICITSDTENQLSFLGWKFFQSFFWKFLFYRNL